MKGRVCRVIAGYYDILANGKEYRVRGSGNLRNLGFSPIVGDFVEFNEDEFIISIYDRQNELVRPKVANIDLAAIVTSLKEPDYSSYLLNKFLAIIEYQNIEPIIIFTKKDLTSESYIDEFKAMGYKCFEINNNEPNSLKVLDGLFKDKLTVFTGQTGAGKSSTISNLASVERETQEISKSLGRGKHTTRVVEIIQWNEGYLIDTPGFSSLDVAMTQEEVSKSWVNFRDLAKTCKFKNCLHTNEPSCAVKNALEDGIISPQRYNDYVRLLREVANGK